MQAELIFTGTELLLGEVTNTHGQYLGRKLSELGIEVVRHTAVGDCKNNLKEVLRGALARSDIVFTTGGLGPTTDDVTKESLAELLGLEMVLNESALNCMREFFKRRGTTVPDALMKQAYMPAGAEVLPNLEGSAPGVMLKYGNRMIFMLPGPPRELRSIFENSVQPVLAGLGARGEVTYSKVFKLTGISESEVQVRLADISKSENPLLAFVAKPGEVDVRVTARAEDIKSARIMAGELGEKVRERLSGYIFGTGNEVLEATVGKLLTQKGVTVAVAESCTGGLIAKRLTDIAGSSRYFMGGVVAYDNTVKSGLLGVPTATLAKHGAVSREVAVSMAQGIRHITGSELGLAVTGIAGPEGGSPQKPVGLVYIALAASDGTCCREFRFPGHRDAVRCGAANAGLNMIRLHLLAR